MKFFTACATWYSAGLPALFCLFALGMPSHAIEPDAFIPPDTEFVMNLRPRQILELQGIWPMVRFWPKAWFSRENASKKPRITADFPNAIGQPRTGDHP